MPKHRRAAVAATLALVVSPLARLSAQVGGIQPYRFTVSAHLVQARYDGSAVPGGERNLGGVGGRLMFNRSDPARTLRWFFRRASFGVYADYTAKQGDADVSTLQYGLQGESAIFPIAIARGLLDPFLSLGAGTTRVSADVAGERVTENDLTITPSIGTRVPLMRGLGLRGDLRAPIIFGAETTLNFVATGGGYLSF